MLCILIIIHVLAYTVRKSKYCRGDSAGQYCRRLQFVELQLELIEEWRVRLTQLLGAALRELRPAALLGAGPHALLAVLNAAHYTRTVLLQWAHSLVTTFTKSKVKSANHSFRCNGIGDKRHLLLMTLNTRSYGYF